MSAPRVLYLHGFASSPNAYKGQELRRRFAARGVTVELPNLRLPSFERLRLSAMIDFVVDDVARGGRPTVLVGSSLGGLTAVHAQLRAPLVARLLLLAPAFGMATRWRDRLGEAGLAAWRRDEWLAVHDYGEKRMSRVDVGFLDDALRVEAQAVTRLAPTHIIHGARDEVVPVAQSEALVKQFPSATLEVVDDAHELTSSLDAIEAALGRALASRG